MHDCAIWGSGHVVAVATRAVRVGRSHVPVSPSESRNRDAAILTRRTNYDRDDPASPRSYDYHVWLGGDRRHPQCITVETQPSNPQAYREPLPFPVADLAWAGTTLYILEGGGRSVIYRLDYLSTFDYSCTEVYGAGDDDGHVVGISGMSDDLLVHTRNEEGDRLHLMLSGRTIWQQRDAILEAVAVKYKKPDHHDDKSDKAAETYHKVLMVAMVLADGRVLSVKVPDKIKDKDADEPSDMVAAETTDKKESTGNPRAVVLGEHSRSIVQRSEPLN
ncbi:hypothetical protein Sste5346_004864 [Sporothrix stenoceras]|uniref:Uncharacterized protein n=1 Tax=Sporothrix stenoceras TaxID=5173 RepID=A0ABR3Z7C2_9PEZI